MLVWEVSLYLLCWLIKKKVISRDWYYLKNFNTDDIKHSKPVNNIYFCVKLERNNTNLKYPYLYKDSFYQ